MNSRWRYLVWLLPIAIYLFVPITYSTGLDPQCVAQQKAGVKYDGCYLRFKHGAPIANLGARRLNGRGVPGWIKAANRTQTTLLSGSLLLAACVTILPRFRKK